MVCGFPPYTLCLTAGGSVIPPEYSLLEVTVLPAAKLFEEGAREGLA